MSKIFSYNKTDLAISLFIGGFIGVMAGAQIATVMQQKYTNKSDILKYPKTELSVIREYKSNDQSIFLKEKISARTVPDSILNNIQP